MITYIVKYNTETRLVEGGSTTKGIWAVSSISTGINKNRQKNLKVRIAYFKTKAVAKYAVIAFAEHASCFLCIVKVIIYNKDGSIQSSKRI